VARRTPGERRRRRLGWLFAGLSLFAWQAGAWHDATTVHRVCAEHGEVLDAGARASAERSHPEERPQGPAWSAGLEREEHAACPLVVLGQPASTAPEPVAGAGRPCQPGPAPLRGIETPRSSIPLLLLAPKQSPPA